jgi:hypothetical protein
MSSPYFPFYSKTLDTDPWQYIYPMNSVLCANFVFRVVQGLDLGGGSCPVQMRDGTGRSSQQAQYRCSLINIGQLIMYL